MANLVIVSKDVMYLFHVGVLKNRQNGTLSSRFTTQWKNVLTASISSCVSVFCEVVSSRQPSRVSRATLASAVTTK